jgi:hypothetical protein
MRKLWYITREMVYLMRQQQLYVLALIFLVLILVAFFVYQVTPLAIVTFVYAGI